MVIKRFLTSRYILYPAFSLLFYWIAKRWFPTEADKANREKLKNFPETAIIKDPLDVRGGYKPGDFFSRIFDND